jgi:hypothetical protein
VFVLRKPFDPSLIFANKKIFQVLLRCTKGKLIALPTDIIFGSVFYKSKLKQTSLKVLKDLNEILSSSVAFNCL